MTVVDRIIAGIEADLLDRRSLKSELRQYDPDVREQIRAAWRQIIMSALALEVARFRRSIGC